MNPIISPIETTSSARDSNGFSSESEIPSSAANLGVPWIEYPQNLARKLSRKLDALLPFSLIVQVVGLIFVLSWFALIPVRLTSVTDPDLGWHLRSGEWIMQHHQLLRRDHFSITGMGVPWVAYSWPFSVLIYEIARNFDLLGIAAYSLFGWMASVLALFVLLRMRGAEFWRAVGLTFIGGATIVGVSSARPGVITVVCFTVLLTILIRERERGYTRMVWVVPPLIWLWANIHVQFVYGLFIIGVFCVEPILDRFFLPVREVQRFSPRLWAVLLVSAAATLLNPYGFGSYEMLLNFARHPEMAGYIIETQAMSFTVYMHYMALLLALGAAFVLARSRPVKPLWVILLLWATASAFRMERDIWLLVVVTVAVMARRSDTAPARPLNSRLRLYAAVGVLIVTVVGLMRVPSNKYLLSLIATRMPVGAVAYIHEHHLKGPIFNDYDWGGFLIYALPKYPVAIDGRAPNVHSPEEVGRSLNTWAVGPGWEHDPLLAQANLVIGSPRKALTYRLRTDPEFKVLYDDGVGVLFERVTPTRAQATARP